MQQPFEVKTVTHFAVEEECLPDLIAIYVEPEYDTASLLPKPSGMIRIPAYTEGISLC